jgi:DNA-directed RNA polymerase beta subunit
MSLGGFVALEDPDVDQAIVHMVQSFPGLRVSQCPDGYRILSVDAYMDTVGVQYNTPLLQALGTRAEYASYCASSVDVVSFDQWVSSVSVVHNAHFQRVTSIVPVPNCMIADITTESANHSFVGGRGGFLVHNSAMGKQAIGLYSTNYQNRYDSVGHTLNYPQKPLVYTRTSKVVNIDSMPCGINVIVAIATYTGFNQEDSLIMNRSSVDRGLFQSTVYRTYKDQNNKNHSTGEEEVYCNPANMSVKQLKPYNYSKLNAKGFVDEDTCVSGNDIIVGKCMPQKVNGAIVNKDMSISLKNNETCFIDRNCIDDKYFVNVNGDGYNFSKVRIRTDRIPTIGDKFSSRMGQKGTVGMIYRQEDMPFTKDGMVPDIIMNPHAIPSRMTIGQLMECIMGKSCAMLGTRGDGTPFTDIKVEELADTLQSCGLERYGNEVLYNSRTGEMMETEIFMGPTYYQRLKHLVQDKIHCLTLDHEVLTDSGWKFFPQLVSRDKVATLQDG